MKLDDLNPGQIATVVSVSPTLDKRVLELGFTPGTTVELTHRAPFGGSIAVLCRGSQIAIRREVAVHIEVSIK